MLNSHAAALLLPLLLLLSACLPMTADAETPQGSHEGRLVVHGGRIVGLGPADLEITNGTITALGAVEPAGPQDSSYDATGKWLSPAFIDSHVHLAYLPAAREMARGGIAAAVDQAAPLSFLDTDQSPLRVRASGPMVTALAGYPTRSWGSDGYGLECSNSAEAVAAVQQLVQAGADLVKLPVTGEPVLDPASLRAAADAAHAAGLKVSSHALSSAEASLAAEAGADLLAHTPVAPLSPKVIAQWSDRAVVSTLRAFGGGASARSNLASLAEAGATILYGTDFGNTRDAGIDGREIELMIDAGLSPSRILASGTTDPAAFWGFEDLGSLQPGKSGSFLVLDRDPLSDPLTLSASQAVFIDGIKK
ncbi:MAG: amidohydrolase family protein [Myxococcota bacterium]|nr:amidohydrolase family protein [Myxococcota bacterium]